MTGPNPETQLDFWNRKAKERALDVAKLQTQLAHVYALLTAALAIAVRHGIAADVEEALSMAEEEVAS